MRFSQLAEKSENGNYPQLRSNEELVSDSRLHGAVGDVLGRFIGGEGEILDIDANRRMVSIPMESLMRIPLRIGIGGGSSKIRAARAALKYRLVNVFVWTKARAKQYFLWRTIEMKEGFSVLKKICSTRKPVLWNG